MIFSILKISSGCFQWLSSGCSNCFAVSREKERQRMPTLLLKKLLEIVHNTFRVMVEKHTIILVFKLAFTDVEHR